MSIDRWTNYKETVLLNCLIHLLKESKMVLYLMEGICTCTVICICVCVIVRSIEIFPKILSVIMNQKSTITAQQQGMEYFTIILY